jgi:hypothetical protein
MRLSYPSLLGSRRALVAVLATLGAFLALLSAAPPASAANYSYWGYYQFAGGTWSFSQKGPAETNPADGSIEGWRWAITDDSGTTPRAPRVSPTFDAVCGSTPAEADKKRVAVVVDYGRAVDGTVDGNGTTTPPEPTADCAVVATGATGQEVLAAVATVRTGNGLVCGIDSYPASGCTNEVATLTDEQKAADTPVTLGQPATPQTQSPSSATSTTPGVAPTAVQTAGPVVAGATTQTSSGVPVVVWIGLAILVLGAALLAYSAYRRRQRSVP